MISVKKQGVITAAITLALKDGFFVFTRNSVAEHLGVQGSSINFHFPDGGLESLRAAVMREALHKNHIKIIAEGLANGYPAAIDWATPKQKLEASKLVQG